MSERTAEAMLDIKMRCAVCEREFVACIGLVSQRWRVVEGPVAVAGVAYTTVCPACAVGAPGLIA